MVADSGGAEGFDASIIPLNLPQPIEVETDADGRLTAVWVRGRRRPVVAVRAVWRVDDRWWRDTRLSRLYLSVLLDDGLLLTVFTDLLGGGWYRQSYD